MESIEVQALVSRLLESVGEPGSKNRVDAFTLRDFIAEYLALHDSEVERFPQFIGQTHSDLVMADYDLSRDAVFVAYAFEPGQIVLFGGRGNAAAIKYVAEHESSEDFGAFCQMLHSKASFTCPAVTVPRAPAVAWLGRDWK